MAVLGWTIQDDGDGGKIVNRIAGAGINNAGSAYIMYPPMLRSEYYTWGTGFQVEGGTPNNSAGKKSNDSRSIYWYHTTSALYQSNESGVEYYVIAIG